MAITWQEVEAAGYFISEKGKILDPAGKQTKQYILDDRINVKVYLPRQEGKSKPWTYVRLHRMVAAKYVPNPEGYKHVGFKRNMSCKASNLFWAKPQDAVHTQLQRDKQYAVMMLNEGLMNWREAVKLGVSETRAYRLWRKANATI